MLSILTIQEDCLYAVKYDGQEFDEYNRIFEDHANLSKVLGFFETNRLKIGDYYIKEMGLGRDEIEAFAQRVVEDAVDLEEYFEMLIDNTVEGNTPDLYGHFKILEGFEGKDTPAMKSYGLNRPSMLRVYAIEVDRKSLIVFYSGIKINHRLEDCPELNENVLRKANQLIDYLKEIQIMTSDDLEDLAN